MGRVVNRNCNGDEEDDEEMANRCCDDSEGVAPSWDCRVVGSVLRTWGGEEDQEQKEAMH